mgnify:CR=1 FL=1
MLFYIIKTVIISLFIIISIHYFYLYLIKMFTVKKKKNLINDYLNKYTDIFKTLNNNNIINKFLKNNNQINKDSMNKLVNNELVGNELVNNTNMEDELKEFYNNIKAKWILYYNGTNWSRIK